VTSSIANLIVSATPVPPVITSGTNYISAFVGGTLTFPRVTASGTQPFTYQWYNKSGVAITDDGVKYVGSTTPSLTISNLAISLDSSNYYVVVMNPSSSYASNIVDVLTVIYRKATINAGQPAATITFTNVPTSLTAGETGGSLPITNQWFKGSTLLTDGTEFTGTATSTLNIAATTTADTAANYYLVVSNPGGSVTSALASVTVLLPPPHTSVSYSNQVYSQNFDVLPDPGTQGIKSGLATGSGISVNSINNPLDPGQINGVSYSLANPFDFAYPVLPSSFIGGLGLSTGATNIAGQIGSLNGWYGAADTNRADAGNPDGITRFAAQDGDQSTGGVIDFGPNDVDNGIVGTNRSLGLLSTSSTGSTSFGLKLVNSSTNTLNYITLSYLGEIWRNNRAARTMSFSYAIDPTANTFVLSPEPTATNASPQIIPGTVRVPSMAFSFPTNDGSILAVDGTSPANQISMVTSNLALSTPWQPGAALWLIWSINYYGQGTGQGYAIDNLKFSASVVPSTLVQPVTIASSSVKLSNADGFMSASFSFTNAPNLSFSVRATNNITAPKATWPVVGAAVENPAGSGHYQFTDSTAATNGVQFYLISLP
jgi:hypothetical protein